ncbi:MAG TPA: diguanylate cyclase [Anaerolineales bacterium]|nr:diguanylate cyclase [Anaerolineales bacterium]
MKALILEQNAKERSLIQHVLEKIGHEAILGVDMEQAWQMIEKGEARFIIADGDADDFKKSNLIGRARVAKIMPVYFLVVTAGEGDQADADDNLHKPLFASELKARIMIGQRFLALGESLSKARQQLENLALYDSLTGLMNRIAFFRSAQGELERARRSSSPLSMIAIDIDRFKSLNATHGVEMGDEVLRIVGQTIREKSRPYDCIGRWTGDEFVIALPGVIGADAEKITERIIKGIDSTSVTLKNDSVIVGVSAGIVSASRISASTEAEPLIEQARQAMMRAKEAGGDQVYLTYI